MPDLFRRRISTAFTRSSSSIDLKAAAAGVREGDDDGGGSSRFFRSHGSGSNGSKLRLRDKSRDRGAWRGDSHSAAGATDGHGGRRPGLSGPSGKSSGLLNKRDNIRRVQSTALHAADDDYDDLHDDELSRAREARVAGRRQNGGPARHRSSTWWSRLVGEAAPGDGANGGAADGAFDVTDRKLAPSMGGSAGGGRGGSAGAAGAAGEDGELEVGSRARRKV
jgi:hypothetical protein